MRTRDSIIWHMTIKIVVREILPIAIEKRYSKGNPLLEAEAVELSVRLKTLGIDLHKEIIAMNLLKERPKTGSPPIAIQKILDAAAFLKGHQQVSPWSKLR